MKIVCSLAALSLLGGCTAPSPTAPVDRTVEASPDGDLMVDGLAPVCVGRPENPGIMNVTPLIVEYVGTGSTVTLVGGAGACSWLDKGRFKVILRDAEPGGAVLATTQIEVKTGSVTQLGICLVEEADESIRWALLTNSATCNGTI